MNTIIDIVVQIISGITGSAFYDGLKMLFGYSWAKFTLSKDDKTRLMEGAHRELELRKNDTTFSTNPHDIIQQCSAINILTGVNPSIQNNPQVHRKLDVNNDQQPHYYGVKKDGQTKDEKPVEQGGMIFLPLFDLYPSIRDKVF